MLHCNVVLVEEEKNQQLCSAMKPNYCLIALIPQQFACDHLYFLSVYSYHYLLYLQPSASHSSRLSLTFKEGFP